MAGKFRVRRNFINLLSEWCMFIVFVGQNYDAPQHRDASYVGCYTFYIFPR